MELSIDTGLMIASTAFTAGQVTGLVILVTLVVLATRDQLRKRRKRR